MLSDKEAALALLNSIHDARLNLIDSKVTLSYIFLITNRKKKFHKMKLSLETSKLLNLRMEKTNETQIEFLKYIPSLLLNKKLLKISMWNNKYEFIVSLFITTTIVHL